MARASGPVGRRARPPGTSRRNNKTPASGEGPFGLRWSRAPLALVPPRSSVLSPGAGNEDPEALNADQERANKGEEGYLEHVILDRHVDAPSVHRHHDGQRAAIRSIRAAHGPRSLRCDPPMRNHVQVPNLVRPVVTHDPACPEAQQGPGGACAPDVGSTFVLTRSGAQRGAGGACDPGAQFSLSPIVLVRRTHSGDTWVSPSALVRVDSVLRTHDWYGTARNLCPAVNADRNVRVIDVKGPRGLLRE